MLITSLASTHWMPGPIPSSEGTFPDTIKCHLRDTPAQDNFPKSLLIFYQYTTPMGVDTGNLMSLTLQCLPIGATWEVNQERINKDLQQGTRH